jgi:hypothetical protein
MGIQRIWKYVSSEWFYSRSAVFLFSTSAGLVLLTLALGWSLEFVPASITLAVTQQASNPSLAIQLGFALVGVLLTAAYAFVLLGMFRFWTAYDRSSPMTRKIWFVIMIAGFFVGISLGTALYCLAVYLPQVLKNPTRQSQGLAV